MRFSYPIQRRSSAFTLVEILVVIAIIAVLTSIVVPVAKAALSRGKLVRETNAARNIMVGYTAYAIAHDGDLLPGYDKTVDSVELPSGTTVSGEMCCRYPWRIAPYLGEQIEGIFLVGDNTKSTGGKSVESFDYQYRASLNPALGINAYCIGGYNDGSGEGGYGSDVVRKLAGALRPSSLIVFASARMKIGTQKDTQSEGHFLISPPKLDKLRWSSATYNTTAASASYGNVSLRYDNKAVCAFLDGHVALLEESELRDMRHWSNAAVVSDNKNQLVSK